MDQFDGTAVAIGGFECGSQEIFLWRGQLLRVGAHIFEEKLVWNAEIDLVEQNRDL